jgi:hypothetical protein
VLQQLPQLLLRLQSRWVGLWPMGTLLLLLQVAAGVLQVPGACCCCLVAGRTG